MLSRKILLLCSAVEFFFFKTNFVSSCELFVCAVLRAIDITFCCIVAFEFRIKRKRVFANMLKRVDRFGDTVSKCDREIEKGS